MFPSDYRLALTALNEGRPFVAESHSKLSSAVTAFARELTGLPADEAASPPKPTALLARFGALRWTTSS